MKKQNLVACRTCGKTFGPKDGPMFCEGDRCRELYWSFETFRRAFIRGLRRFPCRNHRALARETDERGTN